MDNIKLEIGSFPFYWRTTGLHDNKIDFPTKVMDFNLMIDEVSGFFKQERSKELLATIGDIYQLDHNIGYLQEGAGELETYGRDFFEFIVSAIEHSDINTSQFFSVLDIGCGGGFVLNQLSIKYLNAKVMGIEPSPIAKRASQKLGFLLIEEFYPPEQRNRVARTNIILHYDVLEHVEEPLSFLEDVHQDLAEDGIVIFSVPDCTTAIENGDISMLIHEHLNYFSVDSLGFLVKQAGFENVKVIKGDHGGTLLCSARKGNKKTHVVLDKKSAFFIFERFKEKNKTLVARIDEILAKNSDKTIGFYVPLRAIPYISTLKIKGDFRFFDDSDFFRNKYLDGFNEIVIEGFEELKKHPVDIVIIMTHAYGMAIAKRISDAEVNTKTILLQELFDFKR